MTVPSDAMDESPLGPRPILSATRPFYWSLRRELWENRSLYIAPAVVAALVLFGFLISIGHPPHWSATGPGADGVRRNMTMPALPYDVAAFAILITGFIVAFFYCLGALYDERRDRGILFWKSLPVSDFTTVLAKASVPLAVLPLILFVAVLATQLTMLLVGAGAALARGRDVAGAWGLPWFHMTLALLYCLAMSSLWLAPLWGWLLLVSGWARRAPFLWAVLPPLALCLVEKIGFDTGYFAALLRYRLTGWFDVAFVATARGGDAVDPLTQIDPVGFLTTPGLWAGLAVALAFLALAVRQRRHRGPI
ncbi:MAG: ABC transporter permease [Pseudomonadota bacterium]|nr:ABC transporter permease [Pseudomonadota bacterium]